MPDTEFKYDPDYDELLEFLSKYAEEKGYFRLAEDNYDEIYEAACEKYGKEFIDSLKRG